MHVAMHRAKGIPWQHELLKVIYYVDDIALQSSSHKDMQNCVNSLNSIAGQVSLQIKTKKTKILKLNYAYRITMSTAGGTDGDSDNGFNASSKAFDRNI